MNATGAIVYRGSNIINTFTGEIRAGDIVVRNGLIVSVDPPGSGIGDMIADVGGTYASPGFMDAHTHTESSLLNLRELSRLILPHGTTCLFTNPHEIANVLGVQGVKRHLAEASNLPIRLYLVSPCKVPAAPGLETTGAAFGLPEVLELLSLPDTVAVGEFDAADFVKGNPAQMEVLSTALKMGKIPCGHAPGVVGESLRSILLAGLSDDHESHGAEEVMEKIRLGMTVFLREGTTEKNTVRLVSEMLTAGFPLDKVPNLCFCTDDKHPTDIVGKGHINENMRLAVAAGMDPITAVRAATLNCARHYGLRRQGALAPGFAADIVFLKDLTDFIPESVVSKGEMIFSQGVYRGTMSEPTNTASDPWPCSVNTGDLTDLLERLAFPPCGASPAKATVIGMVPGQIITERLMREIPVSVEGSPIIPPDLNKVCVLDRHSASGRIGIGLIDGFRLMGAAIASSVAHDHHNFVAVGDNDPDIAQALKALAGMGGGFVIVSRGRILAELPLPIAGLMTDGSLAEVNGALERLNKAAAGCGCRVDSPFMALSFVTLPVVPELGITDMGLIDVRNTRVIPLFV